MELGAAVRVHRPVHGLSLDLGAVSDRREQEFEPSRSATAAAFLRSITDEIVSMMKEEIEKWPEILSRSWSQR